MKRVKWQEIDIEGVEFQMFRASVPGGWLVAIKYYADKHSTSFEDYPNTDIGYAWGAGYGYGGLTFVPDPNHERECPSPGQAEQLPSSPTQPRASREPRW